VVAALCFTLISCSVDSSSPTMEAICSSKTSVDFQLTTQRYIPEDLFQYSFTLSEQ
jgi:hypothetical protein